MGMVAVMRRLADQMLLSARGADPYVQSHPLPGRPADRRCEQLASQSPYAGKKDPPELQLRHDLVRAKLVGFTLDARRRSAAATRRATTACRRATPAPSPPTGPARSDRR